MNIAGTLAKQVITQASDAAGAAKLAGMNATARSAEEINGTAREFEAVFLATMMRQMFAGIEVNEVFGGGHGEEAFREMLYDEYGKAIAKAGGVGIADAVQREMLRLQGMEA